EEEDATPTLPGSSASPVPRSDELRPLARGDDPSSSGLSQQIQTSPELFDTRREGAPAAPGEDANGPDDAQPGQEKPTHAVSCAHEMLLGHNIWAGTAR